MKQSIKLNYRKTYIGKKYVHRENYVRNLNIRLVTFGPYRGPGNNVVGVSVAVVRRMRPRTFLLHKNNNSKSIIKIKN